MPDYVSVAALTPAGQFVLVRQYRPAVEQYTLELPGGYVDEGERPEASAHRELLEETGYRSAQMEFLGAMHSDTGRNENRVWCYLAPEVEPIADWSPEPGLEVVLVGIDELHDLILRGEFNHALNLAALMQAILRRDRCLATLMSERRREP
jgi:ADP-ribose pyrophosphatase